MSTFFKLIIVLVLWQAGVLSAALFMIGGVIMWLGAMLQPNLFFGVF